MKIIHIKLLVHIKVHKFVLPCPSMRRVHVFELMEALLQ
jgi:hypothetical protein